MCIKTLQISWTLYIIKGSVSRLRSKETHMYKLYNEYVYVYKHICVSLIYTYTAVYSLIICVHSVCQECLWSCKRWDTMTMSVHGHASVYLQTAPACLKKGCLLIAQPLARTRRFNMTQMAPVCLLTPWEGIRFSPPALLPIPALPWPRDVLALPLGSLVPGVPTLGRACWGVPSSLPSCSTCVQNLLGALSHQLDVWQGLLWAALRALIENACCFLIPFIGIYFPCGIAE